MSKLPPSIEIFHSTVTDFCLILSCCSFAWGAAAVGFTAPSAGDTSTWKQSLLSKLPLDPARCALTVAHFPEWKTLTGDDSLPESTSGPGMTGGDGTAEGGTAPIPLPQCSASYDPSFLLAFCVAALRQRVLSPRVFAQMGLASVCLRATAALDPGLRGMAYECLGLLGETMQGPVPGSKPAVNEGDGPAAGGEDFKERAQLR